MTPTLQRSAYTLTPSEWRDCCAEWGVPPFRAEQIRHWLYARLVASFAEMRNLPRPLRDLLATELLDLEATARLARSSGTEGRTRKLLLALRDGQLIETVLIPMRRGGPPKNPAGNVTLCVSSQAGCAFGCAFCASGKRGLARDLTTGEIVAQAIHAARLLGGRPSHVVFMGIGEPFANYDAVLRAVRTLNDPAGLGIGARRITLSTCGVVPGIRRLATEGLQIELSVSLHAPTDAQRSAILPVNQRWPLSILLEACREYTQHTRRIITFEYTLVRGFNDRPSDAESLLRLLRGLSCRVNLIPLSPVGEFDGAAPTDSVLRDFHAALLRGGVHTTVRRSRGEDLDAACGQLRLHQGPSGVAAASAGVVSSGAGMDDLQTESEPRGGQG